MDAITENNDKTEKSLEAPLKETGYGMFVDRTTYIDCLKVFYAYFSTIGSMIFIYGLDPKPLSLYIEENFKADIINIHQSRVFVRPKKQIMLRNILYILKNRIVFDILNDGTTVICFTRKGAREAKRIAEIFIAKFTMKRTNVKSSCISVITQSMGELRLVDLENKHFKNQHLFLKTNYEDGFTTFHNKLVARLKKNESGICLFHGLPGTGKSSYIRFLISKLPPNKRVIFLPVRLAMSLDSMALTAFLLELENCLLVVEDSEDLVKSRLGTDGNSNIAMLLNITSGILGDILKIQVLATFNCKLENIDPALLREGRLIARWEFGKLQAEKANALINNLTKGKGASVSEPVTLAEIYKKKDPELENTVSNGKVIGFKNKA